MTDSPDPPRPDPGHPTSDPDRTHPHRPAGADTGPTEPSAAEPVDLPGYEILGVLGRGGMGVAYKAHEAGLNRVVAVKVVRAGRAASPDELRRFRAEAEAAAGLDHPGIVPVFRVGEHAGLHYFTMAFVDGPTLADRAAAGPLSPREAAELVRQVAEAVQYAHGRGVVHRDLKPSNVLVGPDGRPRVADFGLAKRVEVDSGLTATGAVLGTPSYMAPEQARGHKGVGPAADVYGLGAVLYHLLTGRPPFHGANVVETLRQVAERRPAPPRELNPAVPRSLEGVCLKCLAKRPEDRYPSAAAAAADLRRYLAGGRVEAPPVGRLRRGLRWARRHPVPPLLAVALLGLLAWDLSPDRPRVTIELDRDEVPFGFTPWGDVATFRDVKPGGGEGGRLRLWSATSQHSRYAGRAEPLSEYTWEGAAPADGNRTPPNREEAETRYAWLVAVPGDGNRPPPRRNGPRTPAEVAFSRVGRRVAWEKYTGLSTADPPAPEAVRHGEIGLSQPISDGPVPVPSIKFQSTFPTRDRYRPVPDVFRPDGYSFSPDGRVLAQFGVFRGANRNDVFEIRAARFWGCDDGRPLGLAVDPVVRDEGVLLTPDGGSVFAAGFLPPDAPVVIREGKLVGVRKGPGELAGWELGTGRHGATFPYRDRSSRSTWQYAFSPDGTKLAVVGGRSSDLASWNAPFPSAWEVATGEPLWSRPADWSVWAVGFTADGRTLVALVSRYDPPIPPGGGSGPVALEIRAVDLATREERVARVQTADSQRDPYRLFLAPDRRTAFIQVGPDRVEAWDVVTLRRRAVLSEFVVRLQLADPTSTGGGETPPITADGKVLVYVGPSDGDGGLRFWDPSRVVASTQRVQAEIDQNDLFDSTGGNPIRIWVGRDGTSMLYNTNRSFAHVYAPPRSLPWGWLLGGAAVLTVGSLVLDRVRSPRGDGSRSRPADPTAA